jgi:ABC-type nitrate/sulfonate/bicarbonate transport system permease component
MPSRILPWLFPVFLILFWQLGASVGWINSRILHSPLEVLLATFRTLENLLDSSLQMFWAISHLALTPLVIIWVRHRGGSQDIPRRLRRHVPDLSQHLPRHPFHRPQLLQMATVYGLNRRGLWHHVILSGALASILVGVRFSLGVMWMTLIVAEAIAASSGIGYTPANSCKRM